MYSPNGLSPLRQSACAIPFVPGKSLEDSLKLLRLLPESLTGIVSTLKCCYFPEILSPCSKMGHQPPNAISATCAGRQYSAFQPFKLHVQIARHPINNSDIFIYHPSIDLLNMKTIPLFRDTNIGYDPKFPTQTTQQKGRKGENEHD